MKCFQVVRPGSTRACIAYRLISLTFSLVIFGSCELAGAQSMSPKPVARIIGDGTDNTRPRRVNGPDESGSKLAINNAASSFSFEVTTEEERRAFEMTNEVRTKNGLAALDWDPELCRIARTHSRDMSVLGFFSHQTPEGLRLRDRARIGGIRYRVIAENIAYNQGYDDPGAFAVERWMVSPAHRANLLSSEFKSAAIGSFIAPDGTVYLTQIFILR